MVVADERPVVVTGAAGQLGQTIVASLAARWRVIGLRRHDLDVTRAADVERVLGGLDPRAVINCAGYNQVDKAEDEAQTALALNAFAVLNLARAAAAAGATFVQYSSDFVFDGETDRPYREDDLPAPRSVYAASKMMGEWFAADAPDAYVLRVESLFGGVGPRKSSLDRIVEAIAAGCTLQVFVDRVVSPSYAWDVAEATARLLELRPPAGLYHCVNTGAATWHDVASEIKQRFGSASALESITLADVKLPAPRPRYCALSNEKLKHVGIEMPTWQDAIDRYLQEETWQRKH